MGDISLKMCLYHLKEKWRMKKPKDANWNWVLLGFFEKFDDKM